MPGTRKLGRASDHRKSMLKRPCYLSFGKRQGVRPPLQGLRRFVQWLKMITIAKDDSLHSKRKVMAYVTKEDVVKAL